MYQPVGWMEWGEAAFEEAKRENKPILLDIGAVWCHWCHVMDRETTRTTRRQDYQRSFYRGEGGSR